MEVDDSKVHATWHAVATEESEENLMDGLATDDDEVCQDHAESSRMAEAREQLRHDAELAAALDIEQRLLLYW